MGTRPVTGIMLLSLIFLAFSLSPSCNKEPKPTAIDISQPMPQLPPVELWRKRVVTKPPTDAERDKIMDDYDYDKLAKAEGWTLDRSPILLPDGNILCVTSNSSIDTGNPNTQRWDNPSSLGQLDTMYRLIIISPTGKIKEHKEFEWVMLSQVFPDPAGEFVAFVVQNSSWITLSSSEQEPGKQTICALNSKLEEVWETEVKSPGLATHSFNAVGDMLFMKVDGIQLETGSSQISSSLLAIDRKGSEIWKFVLPEYDLMEGGPAWHNLFGIDQDGNVFFSHSTSVYAIDKKGQKIWMKSTDYSLKSHPVFLPGGNIALAGDTSHKLEFSDFASYMPDYENMDPANMDYEEFSTTYFDEMQKDFGKYQREFDNLPGFLLVLSLAGEVLSELKLPGRPLSSPVAFGNELLLVNIARKQTGRSYSSFADFKTDKSRLMCFTYESELLWDKSFDTGFVNDGIKVVDLPGSNSKCIVAAGDDGNLYSLDESGELLWALTGTNIDPMSLTVGPDGLIYVVADGELVCYQWEG